jgi:hypothetical protein
MMTDRTKLIRLDSRFTEFAHGFGAAWGADHDLAPQSAPRAFVTQGFLCNAE